MIYGDVGIWFEVVLKCGILTEFRIIIDHANNLSIEYFCSFNHCANHFSLNKAYYVRNSLTWGASTIRVKFQIAATTVPKLVKV